MIKHTISNTLHQISLLILALPAFNIHHQKQTLRRKKQIRILKIFNDVLMYRSVKKLTD